MVSNIKKADGLSAFAPQADLFSNQFWDELRAYAALVQMQLNSYW